MRTLLITILLLAFIGAALAGASMAVEDNAPDSQPLATAQM